MHIPVDDNEKLRRIRNFALNNHVLTVRKRSPGHRARYFDTFSIRKLGQNGQRAEDAVTHLLGQQVVEVAEKLLEESAL